MKFILILVIAFLPNYAFGKRVSGYLINRVGDTTEAEFMVPYRIIAGKPDYASLEDKIKIIEDGVINKIYPGTYKQVVFYLKDEEHILYSKRFNYSSSTRAKYSFVRRVVTGSIDIYIHNFVSSSSYMNANDTMSMSSLPGSEYILEKSNGEYLVTGFSSVSKKRLLEFLPEYKEKINKYNSSYISREAFIRLIVNYNEWYLSQNCNEKEETDDSQSEENNEEP